ncbi:MAG: hypothetical protein U5K51_01615 [Flavobacteriaceae bacterium]|nr:hypothetical protein [Flavobacteriaceae bacterium]
MAFLFVSLASFTGSSSAQSENLFAPDSNRDGFERWLVWLWQCAAMWVGFLSSFFAGEEKNKINFHQSTSVKKLNLSFLLFITIYLSGRLSFTLVAKMVFSYTQAGILTTELPTKS